MQEVPTFDSCQFSPKKSEYCICVFVINEGERIQKQIIRMSPYSEQVDIVIADGGSTDGSLDPDFLEHNRVTALLTKTGPGKLSAQMRMALSWAIDQGYLGIIVVDGNNKDDMKSIPLFINALREGYDHIQGSRFIPGGTAINTPVLRHLGLKLLHAPTISLAAGHNYTDTTNGFRAYSIKLLTHPDVQPFRDIFSQYELHYYLAIRSGQLGLAIKEVPVTRIYPERGKIPTKISTFRGNFLILRTLINAAFHRYDP